MSFNQRDDNGLFGPLAGVEIPNGAAAPTVVAHQLIEPVTLVGDAATIIASHKYTLLIAPPNPSVASGITPLGNSYRVLGVSIYYGTAASGAATLALEICPAGTADGSGNNVLSATNYALNTALTANTPSSLALNSNVNNLTMAPNSRLNAVLGATATTALVDLCLCVYVARIS
jgi:hypothetical protein